MLSEIQLHPLTEEINMERRYTSIEEMIEDAKNLGCGTPRALLCNVQSFRLLARTYVVGNPVEDRPAHP